MGNRYFITIIWLTFFFTARGQVDLNCGSMDYFLKDDSVSFLRMYTITISNNDSISYTTWYDEQNDSNIKPDRLIKKRIFRNHIGNNSLWEFLFSSLDNGNYNAHNMFHKKIFFT